jgi:hypothetical protein
MQRMVAAFNYLHSSLFIFGDEFHNWYIVAKSTSKKSVTNQRKMS